jgi:ribonuclease Z
MTFELTILGSSSALPTSTKFPAAHVLNLHERFFLIDCGEGTQMQLRRSKARFGKINHIFISHFHGDHVFGLPGVLSTFSLLGRMTPLHIYAHPEVKHLVDFYERHFAAGNSYPLLFHPIQKKTLHCIFEDRLVEVFAFPLKHRVPTFGFLFREKARPLNVIKQKITALNLTIKQIQALKAGEDIVTGAGVFIRNNELTEPAYHIRSYAYCSDTMMYERIVPFIRHADLLFHEATFLDRDKQLARLTGHSTAGQAAEIAKKAEVKQLIIGHFSNRYKQNEAFLEEAGKVFPNTLVAEELQHYSVPLTREE